MKKMKKGFTLIELLVVIGIIAVLAAVVLASLGGGKDKSADGAIKSDLVNIRTQASLYYEKNFNYGTVTTVSCTGASSMFVLDSVVAAQITHADTQNGATTNSIYCTTNGTQYAVASVLKTDPTKAYCVDSTNTGRVKTGLVSGDASGAITSYACN